LMLGPWRGVGAVGQWGSRMLGGHWRGVGAVTCLGGRGFAGQKNRG